MNNYEKVHKIIEEENLIELKDLKITLSEISNLSQSNRQNNLFEYNKSKLCKKCNLYIFYLINFKNSSKENRKSLLPLLIDLRNKEIEDNILVSISTILYYYQNKNILKCHESYYSLSIGNIAWPIGITNVGIHERNIKNSKKSNIMVNEVRRLWMSSLKSLLN
ncbi:hypothetical protein TBLA_0G01480 [Henningerozyma blattae CBS 6284]|uniref:Pre-mRNA-splicing factor 18 n=1 Tax=Henningerozyma blattae (strain ATCC 34711 / CBS 6284 / DSM 70876 / NBRC 10599 / NRRL Y-10934 / UCD 77-7) TaxID=1071380 RepID=I2H6U2_HENB6|nr:hypothetical protein TBLA_0G01480 [Tetrapisispora blattae CBS 6284]CCH62094.1 hypothetical protein TBLA_0G01480 [Tetrapisispora blattae CBS 6284]